MLGRGLTSSGVERQSQSQEEKAKEKNDYDILMIYNLGRGDDSNLKLITREYGQKLLQTTFGVEIGFKKISNPMET